jgi:hypothetical protein
MKILFFLRFFEDAKWGCLVAMIAIIGKLVLSVHILEFLEEIFNIINMQLYYDFFSNIFWEICVAKVQIYWFEDWNKMGSMMKL